MLNLYDKLREIPLFQGLTSDNLMQIIGQTKFSLKKFGKNEIIKKEGEKCNNIAILLSGDVKVVDHADEAPWILQIEHFMGLSPHYTRTFTSVDESDTVEICQSDLMHISDEFIIFRINMLNIVSAMAQKAERKLWHPMPTELRARIATFLKLRCLSPIGSKVIRIKMTRLAQELGTSRLNVSEALNAMQADGVLHFSRGIISVPQVEKLR